MEIREFRNALGQFATGVTIITTRGSDGVAKGVTVSSFNSVSLDPPLVLWSLSRSSQSLAAFESGRHFVVHVLAAGQKDVALKFAKRGADKFAGLECESGLGNCPLLPDCAARFHCEVRNRYEGGDHVIFVGEVQQFEYFAKRPLIFHSGQFGHAREPQPATLQAEIDEQTGRFGPDFPNYLITRAHFQLYLPLVNEMQRVDLLEDEYFTLSVLCIRNGMPAHELQAFLAHTGHAPTITTLQRMAARQLIEFADQAGAGPIIRIAREGRRRYKQILVLDRHVGERALSGFSADEAREFTAYLRRVIANTDSGSPDIWSDGLSALAAGTCRPSSTAAWENRHCTDRGFDPGQLRPTQSGASSSLGSRAPDVPMTEGRDWLSAETGS